MDTGGHCVIGDNRDLMMWSPTHLQVLVKRAKGLNIKGKNGTNDAFVTIGLGKEKFQTSVVEKAGPALDWGEQAELSIPSQGNTAELLLTVLHRNFLGVDEFLGQATVALRDLDVYERPRSQWLLLKCKPGKNKTDYRGELEVKLGFTVKAVGPLASNGSSADLANKNKGSLASLNKVAGTIGGSLMSIGGKEKKHIKSLAKSVTQKVKDKTKKSGSSLKLNKERSKGLGVVKESHGKEEEESGTNLDPGVYSDEEDEDQYPSPSPGPSLRSRGEANTSSGRSALSSISQPTPTITEEPGDNSVEGREGSRRLSPFTGVEETNKDKSSPKVKGSQSSLPSYNEATEDCTRKKIIPVESEDDSSPSPVDPSGSPIHSPSLQTRNRFRMSQSSINLARHDSGELERKKKSLGLKLKTSYSFVRERGQSNTWAVSPGPNKRRDSVESNNSRTYSESSQGPPTGARVVLGRETSPSPSLGQPRLPHEVLVRFNGKTREDLIEMVVNLQAQLEQQGRKVGDLEDYIDNMLIKILEVAPILLKQPSPVLSKHSIN